MCLWGGLNWSNVTNTLMHLASEVTDWWPYCGRQWEIEILKAHFFCMNKNKRNYFKACQSPSVNELERSTLCVVFFGLFFLLFFSILQRFVLTIFSKGQLPLCPSITAVCCDWLSRCDSSLVVLMLSLTAASISAQLLSSAGLSLARLTGR